MNVTKYKLGAKKAIHHHRNIVSNGSAYSLTVTLNPYWNSFPVHEQYNKLSRELLLVLKELGPYYSDMFITPEFTKDYNIHFHCYFKLGTEVEIETFHQNWKRLSCKSKTIGRDHKLKYIDEITETLLKYPFKDIERTTKYSMVDNCLFNPYHYYFKSTGNILNIANPPGKSIKSMVNDKFMSFVFSTKNI